MPLSANDREKLFSPWVYLLLPRRAYPCGSVVWADCGEFLSKGSRIPGVIQVLGRTQQEQGPINIGNEIYCLDCRRASGLSEEGALAELDCTPIPQLSICPGAKDEKEKLKKLPLCAFFF